MTDLELFLDLDNRRFQKRYNIEQLPMLADGREARLINLSRSGVRFMVEGGIEGEQVQIVLGGRLRLLGKRVWCEKVGLRQYMVGVQFYNEADVTWLNQWLNKVEEVARAA